MENKYLEKIALTRLVKEIAKGTVTKPLSNLANAGLLRKPGIYSQGMAKGNKVIAGKIGASIKKPMTEPERNISLLGGGYVAIPHKTGGGEVFVDKVSLPHTLKGGPSRNLHEALTRHELFELQDAKALSNRSSRVLSENHKSNMASAIAAQVGGNPSDYKHILDRSVNIKPDRFTHHYMQVGQHFSPRVLTRESELVRKNPYLSKLKEHRNSTGEALTVKRITGKTYGQDVITRSDHKRALNAKSTDFNPSPEYIHSSWDAAVDIEEFAKKYPKYNQYLRKKRLPG